MGQRPLNALGAGAVDRFERQLERTLSVGARHQGQGLVHGVSRPCVDVPCARRVGVRGQARASEHQVVAPRIRVRLSLNTSDMAADLVAERGQQQAQRTVEVVAVATRDLRAMRSAAARSPTYR